MASKKKTSAGEGNIISNILLFIPRKLWAWTVESSPRGKVRWAFTSILVLVVLSGMIVYPQGYNQVVSQVNTALDSNELTQDYFITPREETEFNLGLDLQGGAHLVYSADLSEIPTEERTEAMNRLRDRIERRVNALGVSEPVIQIAGENRLVVEIAGVDVRTAIDRIGETPLLEFREEGDAPEPELTEDQATEIVDFNIAQEEKASEIRTQLSSGSVAFEDLAKQHSEDNESKDNGGDLGPVTPRTHPELIEAARDTRIGRVVPGVVDATDGYYIIRVDDRQENDVEMLLSHILICYSGASGCEETQSREEALQEIQRIAGEVTVANFADKAVEYSTDPTAGENEGDLDWVPPATTVASFEEGAKATAVGAISEPIESDFGFHLVYKRDERPYGETSLSVIKFDKKEESDFLPEQEQYQNTGLTGANVIDAQMVFDQRTNIPQISLNFDDEGTQLFSQITQRNLGRQIAIYLDGTAISAPVVQAQITNGEAVITGSFNIDSARELARRLKDGALPLEVELITQQTVGATLGQESLQLSLTAAMIGLLLVALFMLLYYRLFGFLAIMALGVYGIVSLTIFKLMGVTLTLSGIAGFILSIGMAVDANVLIFERFREEREDGKDLDEALQLGFDRAWSSIRDGNVSTLITCFILSSLGTSVVKGFAITLALGVIVSMFSAIIVTRTFARLVIGWRLKKISALFGSGLRLKG